MNTSFFDQDSLNEVLPFPLRLLTSLMPVLATIIDGQDH
jgi:hypothetical protein